MTITLDGTSGITTPTYGGAVTAEYSVPVTTFKNRILNGQMVIDQRNAGASVTPNNSYITDRFKVINSQTSKLTGQQSTTSTTGFNYSLLLTSSSAYTSLTGDYFTLIQSIEGYNMADFGFGTVSASTITLSFWVRSSLTGTFGGSFQNYAQTRSYPFTYTINSANTFEQKTITITGDISGTWVGASNAGAANLCFDLGCGATFKGTASSWAGANYMGATGGQNLVGTNGATFYITGVQLEKGSTATSWDARDYGRELQMCQRYFEASSFWKEGTNALATNFCVFTEQFKVPKRANASVSYGNTSGANANITSISGPEATYDWISPYNANNLTTAFAFRFIPSNATSTLRQWWTASAEL